MLMNILRIEGVNKMSGFFGLVVEALSMNVSIGGHVFSWEEILFFFADFASRLCFLERYPFGR